MSASSVDAAPPGTMQAVVARRYGVAEIAVREMPSPAGGEVRVRVHAGSVNPADGHFFLGSPYAARLMSGLVKPRNERLGGDFAGTVDSIGASVTRFRPGDQVFGAARGALAEFVCVSQDRIALKPVGLTFEQAAAIPVAGLTALQGLRDHGAVRTGQSVLVHGASGGVGTFAVQVAKALGADVTAVCSTPNVEQARSLGADRVVDYTREDFTRGALRHGVMFDVAGGRSWADCARVLEPDATYVAVGGPKTNRWIGPLGHLVRIRLGSLFDRRRLVFFIAALRSTDLAALAELVDAGRLVPIVERVYGWRETTEAYRHLGRGHARGKIVVRVGEGREEPR